ncbi:hypothetical protein DC094_18330 [Pelagibaculum spongiae]|uniref:Uncharacterized protein n=1 Tax=Pelagibaculum spongiae TaxID=2080658 RepID=A0A2V1GWN3_9GAMM|nr:hypothetical protein DC094_18330 [Pelagibaculum spongiae]
MYRKADGQHQKTNDMDLSPYYGWDGSNTTPSLYTDGAWEQHFSIDPLMLHYSSEVYYLNQGRVFRTSLASGNNEQVTIETQACSLSGESPGHYVVYQKSGVDQKCNTDDDPIFAITSDMNASSIALPTNLQGEYLGQNFNSVIFVDSNKNGTDRLIEQVLTANNEDFLGLRLDENWQPDASQTRTIKVDVLDNAEKLLSSLYFDDPNDSWDMDYLDPLATTAEFALLQGRNEGAILVSKEQLRQGVFPQPLKVEASMSLSEDSPVLVINNHFLAAELQRNADSTVTALQLHSIAMDGQLQTARLHIISTSSFLDEYSITVAKYETKLFVFYQKNDQQTAVARIDINSLTAGFEDLGNFEGIIGNYHLDKNHSRYVYIDQRVDNNNQQLTRLDLTNMTHSVIAAGNRVNNVYLDDLIKNKAYRNEPLLFTVEHELSNTLLQISAEDGGVLELGNYPVGYYPVGGQRTVDPSGFYLIGMREKTAGSNYGGYSKAETDLWSFSINQENSLQALKQATEENIRYYPLTIWLDSDEVSLN